MQLVEILVSERLMYRKGVLFALGLVVFCTTFLAPPTHAQTEMTLNDLMISMRVNPNLLLLPGITSVPKPAFPSERLVRHLLTLTKTAQEEKSMLELVNRLNLAGIDPTILVVPGVIARKNNSWALPSGDGRFAREIEDIEKNLGKNLAYPSEEMEGYLRAAGVREGFLDEVNAVGIQPSVFRFFNWDFIAQVNLADLPADRDRIEYLVRIGINPGTLKLFGAFTDGHQRMPFSPILAECMRKPNAELRPPGYCQERR